MPGAAIGQYMAYCNEERIHSALDYRAPNEAAAAPMVKSGADNKCKCL